MSPEIYECLARRQFIFGDVVYSTINWKRYELGPCPDPTPYLVKHHMYEIKNKYPAHFQSGVHSYLGHSVNLVARYKFKCVNCYLRVYDIRVQRRSTIQSSAIEYIDYLLILSIGTNTGDHSIIDHKASCVTQFDQTFAKDQIIVDNGIDVELAGVVVI